MGVTGGLLGVMALGVVVSAVLQRMAVKTRVDAVDGLGFYQAAYLAGGPRRVAEAGFAYLVWAGLIEVRTNTKSVALRALPGPGVELRPVEVALIATVPPEGGGLSMSLGAAEAASDWLLEELDGLVVSPRRRLLAAAPALGTATLTGVVGAVVALSAESAVGLLPLVPLTALVVVLASVRFGRPLLTVAGKRSIDALRERYDSRLADAKRAVTGLPIEAGLYIVALYGREAMTGDLTPLARVLGPR